MTARRAGDCCTEAFVFDPHVDPPWATAQALETRLLAVTPVPRAAHRLFVV